MIEDVILEESARGMDELREYLPVDFCGKAAQFLYENMGTVGIVTGFYVDGFCETDGIVGSVMLGEVLQKMGSDVFLVTDRYCFNVFEKMKVPFEVYRFPIVDEKESKRAAAHIVSVVDPSVLVSVERCGMAKDGLYYNMHGINISEYTAKIDVLFEFPRTIGIGDGGNEIGMGNVYDAVIKTVVHGEKIACIIDTTYLVVSTVSNWGVYGLLTYLSEFEGEMFLRNEDDILRSAVKAGAVDSSSMQCDLKVDGFPLEKTNEIIKKLKQEITI
ncbi:MAG: DUF4392 domain-containing protein [Candidatus Methanofastidiosia archaeon]|jgi:hypothetical protein